MRGVWGRRPPGAGQGPATLGLGELGRSSSSLAGEDGRKQWLLAPLGTHPTPSQRWRGRFGGAASGAARMQPHGRDSRRGPWLRCFLPGGFSGRNLIPSGKKFAWLALGQQLSPSRLPWLAPSRKTLPGPGLLHSHLDVVIRCSWSLDFCQGNGVADLAGRIKILHLENLGCLHWPLDYWAE